MQGSQRAPQLTSTIAPQNTNQSVCRASEYHHCELCNASFSLTARLIRYKQEIICRKLSSRHCEKVCRSKEISYIYICARDSKSRFIAHFHPRPYHNTHSSYSPLPSLTPSTLSRTSSPTYLPSDSPSYHHQDRPPESFHPRRSLEKTRHHDRRHHHTHHRRHIGRSHTAVEMRGDQEPPRRRRPTCKICTPISRSRLLILHVRTISLTSDSPLSYCPCCT